MCLRLSFVGNKWIWLRLFCIPFWCLGVLRSQNAIAGDVFQAIICARQVKSGYCNSCVIISVGAWVCSEVNMLDALGITKGMFLFWKHSLSVLLTVCDWSCCLFSLGMSYSLHGADVIQISHWHRNWTTYKWTVVTRYSLLIIHLAKNTVQCSHINLNGISRRLGIKQTGWRASILFPLPPG